MDRGEEREDGSRAYRIPDPPVSDVVPAERNLMGYDRQHLVTYLRLLDADAEGQIDAGTFSVYDHWTSERASPFFFDSDKRGAP